MGRGHNARAAAAEHGRSVAGAEAAVPCSAGAVPVAETRQPDLVLDMLARDGR
jgi:hypothetical protein